MMINYRLNFEWTKSTIHFFPSCILQKHCKLNMFKNRNEIGNDFKKQLKFFKCANKLKFYFFLIWINNLDVVQVKLNSCDIN